MTARARVDAITRLDAAGARTDPDLVAIEAPLEVIVSHASLAAPRSLGLLMRTPGDDRDLVLGFLFTEGVIDGSASVASCVVDAASEDTRESPARATVTLHADFALDCRLPDRALSSTSACGLCGRLAMRALDHGRAAVAPVEIAAAVILDLPERLRPSQAVFADTGGLHAAALCDLSGAPNARQVPAPSRATAPDNGLQERRKCASPARLPR
jgi:FdhD protein